MAVLLKQPDRLKVLLSYVFLVLGVGVPVWIYLHWQPNSNLPLPSESLIRDTPISISIHINLYLLESQAFPKGHSWTDTIDLAEGLQLDATVYIHPNTPFVQVTNQTELIKVLKADPRGFSTSRLPSPPLSLNVFEGLIFYEAHTTETLDVFTKQDSINAVLMDAAMPVDRVDIVKFLTPVLRSALIGNGKGLSFANESDLQMIPKPKSRVTFTFIDTPAEANFGQSIRKHFDPLFRFLEPLSQFEFDVEKKTGFDFVTAPFPRFNNDQGLFLINSGHMLNSHVKSKLCSDWLTESDPAHQELSLVIIQIPEHWKPLKFSRDETGNGMTGDVSITLVGVPLL